MTLRAQKTYDNCYGATQTTYVNDRHLAEHVAKVDAEDKEAGLVGTWETTVRRVDGRLV